MTRTMSYLTMQVCGIFRSRPVRFKIALNRAQPAQAGAAPARDRYRSRTPSRRPRSHNSGPMGPPEPRV